MACKLWKMESVSSCIGYYVSFWTLESLICQVFFDRTILSHLSSHTTHYNYSIKACWFFQHVHFISAYFCKLRQPNVIYQFLYSELDFFSIICACIFLPSLVILDFFILAYFTLGT